MAATINSAEAVQNALFDVLAEPLGFTDAESADEMLSNVSEVRLFEDAGLLTRDKGLVLRMSNGSEYQITIVQSANAYLNEGGGPLSDDEQGYREDEEWSPAESGQGPEGFVR